MPTKKQLDERMAAEFKSGLKASDSYGDEHLSAQESTERRLRSEHFINRQRENPQGEAIGYFAIDPETNEMRLYPNK